MPGEMVYSACFCCYTSFDFNNILFLCSNEGEFLCFTMKDCIAINEPPVGIGLVTEGGEICALGLYCCRRGLKIPTVLCASKQHFLFCKNAASFPFDSKFVSGPIFAVCCIQCYPKQGIAVAPGAPSIEITDAIEDSVITRE